MPYEKDLIDTIVSKLKKGVQVKSIFSESAVIPNERKKTLSKINFKKFIDEGLLERKMKKEVDVVVVLNEKGAGVMFSSSDGDVDMVQMLHSNDPEFHDWCLDYFKYCQENSSSFQESKIN